MAARGPKRAPLTDSHSRAKQQKKRRVGQSGSGAGAGTDAGAGAELEQAHGAGRSADAGGEHESGTDDMVVLELLREYMTKKHGYIDAGQVFYTNLVMEWCNASTRPFTRPTLGNWNKFCARPPWASGSPPATWDEHHEDLAQILSCAVAFHNSQASTSSATGGRATTGAGAAAAASPSVNPWKRDRLATKYIANLLGCDPEVVSVGKAEEDDDSDDEAKEEVDPPLLVYHLATSLQTDEHETTSNLVVPPNARTLWNVLMTAYSNHRGTQRWAIIGSPGLGKSRSSWHFVRRFVDARRRLPGVPMPVVVFEHRRDGLVWKFVPENPDDGDTSYCGWSCHTKQFLDSIEPCLRDPLNLYIFDAGAAEGSAPSLVPAATVLVCSPDPRHYREFTKSAIELYLGPPSVDALVAAAPYMTRDPGRFTAAVVRERAAKVGPLPRRIFRDQRYTKALKYITEAFGAKRVIDHVEDVLTSGFGGAVDRRKPFSAVFMLTTDDCRAGEPVFVSDYARSCIGYDLAVRVFATLTGRTGKLGGRVELDTTLEYLAFRLMVSRRWVMLAQGHGKPKCVPIRIRGGGNFSSPLARPPREAVYKAIAKLDTWDGQNGEQLAEVVGLGSISPVVDAMDARNRGFKVTLGADVTWNGEDVEHLRKKLGLTNDTELHIVVVHLLAVRPALPAAPPAHTRLYTLDLPPPSNPAYKAAWQAVLGHHVPT